MKVLLDFVPILLFFGTYKFYDIYVATAVLMAGTVVQTAILYAIDRKVSGMQKITLTLILIFGALTLWLQDERFIKWKPSVLYLAIAIALSVAVWTFKKSFLKLMLGAQLELPDRVWMRLNIAWIVYCVLMAIVNGLSTEILFVACRKSSLKPVTSPTSTDKVPATGTSPNATSGVPFALLGGGA